jgi:hypothetical protein
MQMAITGCFFFEVEYVFEAFVPGTAVHGDFLNDLQRFTNALDGDPTLNFLGNNLRTRVIELGREHLNTLAQALFDREPVPSGAPSPYAAFETVTSERAIFWGIGVLDDSGVAETQQARELVKEIFYPDQNSPRHADRIRGPLRWIAWQMVPGGATGVTLDFLSNGGVGGDR